MTINRPFYFLHIPKTAGTTLCFSVFPQLFAADTICPAHDYPELLPMLAGGLERYRLFQGHFYYFFERLLSVKPVLITFLRDPVERVLSLYDHICRDPRHYQHAAMPLPPEGLREAVQSPYLLPPNFQVSSLACDLDPIKTMELARKARPDGLDEYSVIYSEMTKRIPTREDCAIACRRLEEADFVGVVEYFDESLELLGRTFDWPVPSYERLNVAPTRSRTEAIATEILDEIRKANELDYELYNLAKSLLFRRLHYTPIGSQ